MTIIIFHRSSSAHHDSKDARPVLSMLEGVMRKFLLIVPLLAVAGGCVYPTQSLSARYPGQRPMYPRPIGPQLDMTSLPIGRWDNVMMSGVGTPLMVLMMNGKTASGEVVSATSDMVRLRVASGEVEIAAPDVMRIDRLVGRTRDAVKDTARGAAFGAGVVGVLGLVAGHVPPARLFGAGAIVGGYQNYELAGLARGATTIYLAEAADPDFAAAAAVQAAGRSPAARFGAERPCGPGVPCAPKICYGPR
jgi:hypothetical protein